MDEKALLRRRAGARSMAHYVRHLLFGPTLGAAVHADDWWDSLAPGRKAQIHTWITAGRGLPTQVDGQMPLIGEDGTQTGRDRHDPK